MFWCNRYKKQIQETPEKYCAWKWWTYMMMKALDIVENVPFKKNKAIECDKICKYQ